MDRTKLNIGWNRQTGKPIGIEWIDIADHVLMLGATGAGKSTLLEYWMRQLAKQRYGFLLLDPEGTLYDRLVESFAAADLDPSGIRLIDLVDDYCAGLDYFDLAGVDYEEKAAVVLEAILKVSQDDGEFRPLIEKYGDASLRALAKANQPLALLYPFLQDARIRRAILKQANDGFSLNEWRAWEGRNPRDRAAELLGILNRAAIFESKSKLRAIVSARRNAIDWPRAMDDGQMIVAKLQHRSTRVQRLLGILLIDQLTNATLSRPEGRRPFFAIVDEFAQFASNDFLKGLKRFRKRGVHVVLSTQDLDDFREGEDRRLFESAKNNCTLQIVFGMSNFEYCLHMVQQLFPLQITGDSVKYQGEHPIFKPIPKKEEVVIETESHSTAYPGSSHSSSETVRGSLIDAGEEEIIQTTGETSTDPGTTDGYSITRTTQRYTEYEEKILKDTPVFRTLEEERAYYAGLLYQQGRGECYVLYDRKKPAVAVRTPAPGNPVFLKAFAHPDNVRSFVESVYRDMGLTPYGQAIQSLEDEIAAIRGSVPAEEIEDAVVLEIDPALLEEPKAVAPTLEQLERLTAQEETREAVPKRPARKPKGKR